MKLDFNTLGIDIGSTTVKIAILNKDGEIIFSDYQRHYANIQETLAKIIDEAYEEFGDIPVSPMITGSGGLTLSKHMEIPFVQEVVAVATSLKDYAPRTDVAIELGGEDAKIIYFTGGIDQRMNGICAGGTGSFIDQMATLLKTDAAGLNEYAKNYKAIYPIAARCGVFAKTDIQPLINEGATKEDLSASIFQAVVNQTISGLACGKPIKGNVAFLGGPLHFLDQLKEAGKDVIGVGKIYDIFAGQGLTETTPNHGNDKNMEKVFELQKKHFDGLCYINLVDFDMIYGHRRNIPGYTEALNKFDTDLEKFIEGMSEEDVLFITADHGCDPTTPSTDHSREYVPILAYGKPIREGVDLGVRKTFADLGQTISDYLGLDAHFEAESFWKEIAK